jgi:DNA-binding NarL/FixJ family response regulator
MNENLITIALADDHRAVRQAFRDAFSHYSFLSILFEADNGQDLLSGLVDRQPDIVLLDIKMPEINGVKALKAIHERFPNVKVLILSAFFDEVYVAECLQYGINGYLTKSMDIQEIIRAIQTAHRNEMYVTNLLSNAYFKSYLVRYNKSVPYSLPDFSADEINIAELLKQEKTTEEISAIMHFSKRSIELKRDRMKEKAGVKTISGLLLYIIKRGLIE